ncbi:Leucine-binding protein domain-containing protein [Frankia sp. AiPs1]|uniref:ABC transporter substrate-binding protein n=1 Tax=Frankia sp. AiPa1 TaxID=573492 RepID=UPI00202B2B1E|nr:ABC transporter substrate-binding protein [Frankia sp. AiPa1]MCL9759960.1 ABC transporter substrate-binding protein [Frankia sp. AiPa1]
MRTLHGLLRAVGVATAVIVAAAACSSSGSSDGGTSTATGSPIKIGAICTCSGPLGLKGGADTYKAWVASTNAAGGINGHQIEFTLLDDGGTAGKSVTFARTLISKHVVAIVDITNVDEPWAKLVQDAKIPVVGLSTSTTPMYSNPDFYPEGQTENALFPSIIQTAKDAGAKSLGLVYCAEAVQCQEGIDPLKKVGNSLGLPVTYSTEVAATAPNYTAQCIAARDKKIEALFIADVPFVAEKLGANCAQQGYHPIYVVDGEILTDTFLTSPGLKDHLVSPSPNLPYFSDAPVVTTMNAALDKYAPGLRDDHATYGELPSEGWVSGLLFAAAAKAGGLGANGSAPSAAQVITGLNSLKGETLDGFAAPLTFDAGKAHQVNCWFETSLVNGKYSVPNGTKPTCMTSS